MAHVNRDLVPIRMKVWSPVTSMTGSHGPTLDKIIASHPDGQVDKRSIIA
jgi:hypothetical protein